MEASNKKETFVKIFEVDTNLYACTITLQCKQGKTKQIMFTGQSLDEIKKKLTEKIQIIQQILKTNQDQENSVLQYAELFNIVLKKYGIVNQLHILTEELAELAVSASHLARKERRTPTEYDLFASEIADVEIMLMQMKHFFPDLGNKIDNYISEKIKKLSKKVLSD